MDLETAELKCRSCGAPIPKGSLSPKFPVASCTHCGVLTSVKVRGVVDRAPVALPKGFHLEEDGPAFFIVYDGGGLQPTWLLFFALMGGASFYAFAQLRRIADQFSFMEVVAFAAAPVAGVVFATLDATGLLNRKRIRVSRERVTVASGPLAKEKSLYARDIVQIFTREFVGRETGVSYEVVARARDGSLSFLLGGLPQADQALYIEQRIERALRIEDVPVPGELPRPEGS